MDAFDFFVQMGLMGQPLLIIYFSLIRFSSVLGK